MMYSEFIEIAGYDVTYSDYKKYIEPMYMASTATKQEFVKMIDRKRFESKSRTEADIIQGMKKDVRKLYQVWGISTDLETELHLEELRREYDNMFWNFNGAWTYFHRAYEYPGMRGCSCPLELVIMCDMGECRRIKLLDI